MDPSSTEYQEMLRLYHHLFLPPKLPQHEEKESSELYLALTTRDALESWQKTDTLHVDAIGRALRMIEQIIKIHSRFDDFIDETQLLQSLVALGTGHTIALNIQAQNAGVLVTRQDEILLFETFELSARNEDVMATSGRLIRTFPGRAVKVDRSWLRQCDFSTELVRTLGTMCQQVVPDMQPQTVKADASHDEIRDTTQPSIVSELLFVALRSIGDSVSMKRVQKSTRDEVNWDRVLKPWRRSPMWLMIRVSLQLVIERSTDGSRSLYKRLMLYLMSHVLKRAHAMGFSVEALFTMTAKITRRLTKILKIDGALDEGDATINHVYDVLELVNHYMATRWKSVQAIDVREMNLLDLSNIESERDCYINLPKLDSHIHGIDTRSGSASSTHFTPVSKLARFPSDEPPYLDQGSVTDTAYGIANLQALEHWVSQHLQKWAKETGGTDVCVAMHRLIPLYHRLAFSRYKGNPEGISVMLLTIFELWIVCDAAATRTHPLMLDYDPHIWEDALQSLLLPFREQMIRLDEIETYLRDRRARSKYPFQLMFCTSENAGFPCQFYEASRDHQDLLAKIQAQATTAREEKWAELARVKEEYRVLNGLVSSTRHSMETVTIDAWTNETEERHKYPCRACQYQSQRDALQITVFEEPLPESPTEAKSIVFELDLPPALAYWRDTRSFLLQDILKGHLEQAQLPWQCQLSNSDPHLTKRYFQSRGPRRIDLLSSVKSTCKSHYNNKAIAGANPSSVCVKNGMRYRYFDVNAHAYLEDCSFENRVTLDCTYQDVHQCLRKYLERTAKAPNGRTQNEVIAAQHTCPPDMTMEEFKALATIPFGLQIQWMNITTELNMPGVDFRKLDTMFVFLQCIHQTGPPNGTVSRLPHSMLSEKNHFASLIMRSLNKALQRIRQNWGLLHALSLFVAMAARVLSLNESVSSASMAFLSEARQIATDWTQALRDKAHIAKCNNDRTYFISKSVESAQVCISTFDVDQGRLEDLLQPSANAGLMVEMSIIVQEGHHTLQPDNIAAKLMEVRVKRTLHRGYKILSKNHSGISAGVKKAWVGFPSSGNTWTQALEHTGEWITTGSASDGAIVHYNLLTGELLVDGERLNQPPESYRKHALFERLFGNHLVEVMPTTEPGFKCSTKRSFFGFHVLLGMSGNELLVRASKGSVHWEVIPEGILRGEYPTHYSADYIHWYNFNTGTIKLKAVGTPWPTDTDACWTLQKCPVVEQWYMQKNALRLVGSKSQTTRAISHIVEPLAESWSVHIKVDPTGHDVHVDLHDAKLRFFARRGCAQLYSKDYRTMAISKDQSLGSLIGLRNKLLLQSKDGDKLVLIPESSVSFERDGDHAVVSIARTKIRKVHALAVDPLLGRLITKDDLDCKLYMAYLHALTSFCLPDPLTRCTGAEQALTILRSRSLTSFNQNSMGNISTLEHIARLSPGRQYYPKGRRCMQTTNWDSRLSFLSQDDSYVLAVESVLRSMHRQMSLFSPESARIPLKVDVRSDERLRTRGRMRASFLRVSEFGAEDHTCENDHTYEPRDSQWSAQATNSFAMSSMLSRPGSERHLKSASPGRLWEILRSRKIPEVRGGCDHSVAKAIRYDASHLDPEHFDFILQRFPAAHAWLTKPENVASHRIAILMWVACLAFAKNADLYTIQVLVLFAKNLPSFAPEEVPYDRIFYVAEGNKCCKSTLSRVESVHRRAFGECPEARLPREPQEKKAHYDSRCRRLWEQAQQQYTERLLNSVVHQWPCENPQDTLVVNGFEYTHRLQAISKMRQYFQKWHANLRFSRYLERIDAQVTVLSRRKVDDVRFVESAPSLSLTTSGYFVKADLFTAEPAVLPGAPTPLELTTPSYKKVENTQYRLDDVITALRGSRPASQYEQGWISELEASRQALQNSFGDTKPEISSSTRDLVECYSAACLGHLTEVYEIIRRATELTRPSRFVSCTSIWERVNPTLFLQQLTRPRWAELRGSWRKALITYGLALSNFQRSQRLAKYLDNEDDLIKELNNAGHTSWDPTQYPEWLILEVESGLTIRSVQHHIASQMLSPDTAGNTVMQLNMGEGKSTVIIPMVAISVADGSHLARVIVNRPQSKQMLHMLIAKLGGIINRQVYHLPFVRSPRLDHQSAMVVRQILQECMETGGVLLAQPEHILSLRHMAPEQYLLGNLELGQTLLGVQTFFDENCRDIIDESDENFSVRLELIYTMGTEQIIEASPDRWKLLQEVLEIVRALAPALYDGYPLQVKLVPGTLGEFRRLRVLKTDACDAMIQQLAKYISKNGVYGLQVGKTPEIRDAFERYICEPEITRVEAEFLGNTPFWTPQTQPLILLLRGFLAGGILKFVFGQKRWRVNFGLAEREPPTKLAVPYRAKDCPAQRSEFSHPDVVIALTSLCYYYGGLNAEDLFIAFNHLVESDQADAEYQIWVKDAFDLPAPFRQLQGVNLQDRPQCVSQVFPAFRTAKATVDYFLAQIVFPREMKEFPKKLSASGWDLGKKKSHLTTGFSGTKDSRPTLPLGVQYLDLPEQRHTSALVLEHLLKKENSVTIMPPSIPGVSDAESIINLVVGFERPVQVILDVGAQILELDNLAMAKQWLEQDTQHKEAVVFVDDEDNICVVDREGRVEHLHASSFASSLATCLVFLDQSHTRGIDLKLPRDYRAAVMLGPRLVKDTLVQACMRMRKLGSGQTLEFCVPRDVQTTIVETTRSLSGIGVPEIIHWAITESFAENRRNMPLWAVQGERFLRQKKTWDCGLIPQSAHLLLENESQSIEDRYRAHWQHDTPGSLVSEVDLVGILERLEEFGKIDTGLSTLQEEQERELAPEKEQEREMQHAPPMEPAAHALHPDVLEFVKRGVLREKSTAYVRAFKSLKDTSADPEFPVEQLCSKTNLWVTRDFATTVVPSCREDFVSDLFLRSVRWLITASSSKGNIETVMVISPFEANQLTPGMEDSATRMHVYAPRSNMGYDSMDALDFYTVPALGVPASLPRELAARLNVFAGQLYFSSFDHYVACGKAFSISTQAVTDEMHRNGCKVDYDGFIEQDEYAHPGNLSGLTQSPVRFLKDFALIRNGGRSIERTHFGKFLAGIALSREKVTA